MRRVLLFLLVIVNLSSGKLLIKPEEALKEIFPDAKIEKKSIMIPKAKKKEISKIQRKKLKDSIFIVYLAKRNGKVIGYSLLHYNKVRTKKEAELISFDKNCNVIDTEIIAFYEPPEYIVSKKWQENFKGKNIKNMPVLRQNIPNVTGATLSTRALTDSVREAIAICEVYLKEKFK